MGCVSWDELSYMVFWHIILRHVILGHAISALGQICSRAHQPWGILAPIDFVPGTNRS